MFITVSAFGTVPFSFWYRPTTHIQAFEMKPLYFTVIIIATDHFPLICTARYKMYHLHWLIGYEKHSVLL